MKNFAPMTRNILFENCLNTLRQRLKQPQQTPPTKPPKVPLEAEEKHRDHQPVLTQHSPPGPVQSAICQIIRLIGAVNYCGWNCKKDMIERCKNAYALGASNHWGPGIRQHPTANAKTIHVFVRDITD
jgi:hypothetical protein